MKNAIGILTNVLVLAVLGLPSFAQTTNGGIGGNWLGKLDVGGVRIRLVLKIAKTDDGYMAKLDSPDQGAKDLLIDSITKSENIVNFSAAKLAMNYKGTVNERGDEISGTFNQGADSIPLVFKRIAEIPTNKRAQDPIRPYPYQEEEVNYRNAKDNVKLAGTLTFPHGEKKVPAVILITGSGSQDRDEAVAGHRPFLVLADYLTKKGIAVLRVDDRGVGGSEGDPMAATAENFAGDVLAGIEYLKTRKEIDSKQIGLIGHSEGGMIAPMVAARSTDVSFIVMLAGIGQTGEDLLLTQFAVLQKAGGAKPETVAQVIDFQQKLFAIIKSELDNQLAEHKINDLLAKRKSEMNETDQEAFAQVETGVKRQLPVLLSPGYRYFLSHDPRRALKRIKIPVLALNGENDTQVPSRENLAIISDALKSGKNKNFSVRSFPQLNHLFQTSKSGLPNEYGEIEETISPLVLETIASWILELTKLNGNSNHES